MKNSLKNKFKNLMAKLPKLKDSPAGLSLQTWQFISSAAQHHPNVDNYLRSAA